MPDRFTISRTVSLTELRRNLSEILDYLTETQTVVAITKYGKKIAVLIPIKLYDEWQAELVDLKTCISGQSSSQ
jgi:prevent-host-death family protein